VFRWQLELYRVIHCNFLRRQHPTKTVGSSGATANTTNVAATLASGGATTDLVHCYDANICSGHNDCKTVANACASQASCKSEGFVAMPAKACGDIGGSVKDS
jgi:hypothetical protein